LVLSVALSAASSPASQVWRVFVDTQGKSKMTAEEELRASKGKGKMVDPVDADDDEEDEEDFDEEVRSLVTHYPDLNPTCRVQLTCIPAGSTL